MRFTRFLRPSLALRALDQADDPTTRWRSVAHDRCCPGMIPAGDSAVDWAASPMRLNNLRLPFAIEIVGTRGACRLSHARHSRRLEQGRSVKLPAYELFHVEVESGALLVGSALHLELLAADRPLMAGRWLRCEPGPLTLRIARAAFASPDVSWSRADAAAAMGMSVRELSARLLREGGALTDIVMEQRLMRALLELAHGARVPRTGFSSPERLHTAFFDRFGVSPDRVAATHRRCALSWSGVPSMSA